MKIFCDINRFLRLFSPIYRKSLIVSVTVSSLLNCVLMNSIKKLIYDCLNDNWQKTKVVSSFSAYLGIIYGVAQGSIPGSLLINIDPCDLFLRITVLILQRLLMISLITISLPLWNPPWYDEGAYLTKIIQPLEQQEELIRVILLGLSRTIGPSYILSKRLDLILKFVVALAFHSQIATLLMSPDARGRSTYNVAWSKGDTR